MVMWQRATAVGFLVAAVTFVQVSEGDESAKSRRNGPVAVVSGDEITEREVLEAAANPLRQLRTREYEIKRAALDRIIDQRLFDAEAKQRRITTERLWRDIDSSVAGPTDSEVESYYLAQQDRIKRPLDEVRTQLRDALKNAKVQQARQEHLKRLRASANVKILLTPPKIEVAVDPGRVRGNPNAPVTIVEFSDFQCPYCQKAEPTVKEVLKKYDGQVRLAYRDFPLSIHAQAQGAAEASRCAAEQGKFWEYHDALFTPGAKLDTAGLKAEAKKVGLDDAKFGACVASGRFKDAVAADERDGAAAGVSGTPAFFVNGVLLSGAQPLAAFERAIDDELARVRAENPVQKSN